MQRIPGRVSGYFGGGATPELAGSSLSGQAPWHG